MNTGTKDDPKRGTEDDAQLNAALSAWHVPPPSPWLAQRVVQGIVAGQRRPLWPVAPLRLVAAISIAAVVGLILGFTVPGTDDANAANDSETMIEMMW